MGADVRIDLRNLVIPVTPLAQFPEVHSDLLVLRDAIDNLAAGVLPLVGGVLTGDLTVSSAEPSGESSISTNNPGGGSISMLARGASAASYGVFIPGGQGFYANNSMAFLSDSGGWFRWGWPQFAMGLDRRIQGGNEAACLTVGTAQPNIYLFDDPATGKGLRIHYSDIAGVAIIDTAKDLRVRDETGGDLFIFNRQDRSITIAARTGDPASPSDGTVWNNLGTLRKRSGGVTSNL